MDPEPGKPSPWHQGVVREQQVLICPDCYSAVAGDLAQCARCGSVRLIKRLGQVECLDCRATRDADTEPAVKGDTSGKVLKTAKLATGLEISVPLFVQTGDKVEIDTRTHEYKKRV